MRPKGKTSRKPDWKKRIEVSSAAQRKVPRTVPDKFTPESTGSGATRPDSEQPPNLPVLIWRGFRHQWEYNHRLNRLGDYVKLGARSGNSIEADLVHAAAAGTGQDTATFTSYYSELQTNNAWFKSGHRVIRINAHEETPGYIQRDVAVSLPEELQDRKHYTVLLNGFDLIAERDADKLLELHLGVSAPKYDTRTGELKFTIDGLVNVDCDTYECDGYASWELGLAALSPITGPLGLLPALTQLAGKFNITTDYTLHVHFLIVGGDNGFFVTESDVIENHYNFDKKTEIKRGKTGQRSATLKGEYGKYAVRAVGIKSLHLSLQRSKGFLQSEEAMHLLQLDMNVRPQSSTLDQMDVELDLFYKNWREGMKNAHPPSSLLAHKDAGAASVGMSLVFLQFEGGNLDHDHRDSKIVWNKSNADADSKYAMSELLLPPERYIEK